MNSEFGCLLVMGKVAVASERWYVWYFLLPCFLGNILERKIDIAMLFCFVSQEISFNKSLIV